MTGLIGLLMGFIQALLGLAHGRIQEIGAAISFVISVTLYALLGLVAVAGPLEDRDVMEGRRERPAGLSRLAWTAFPLLAFIFLRLAFVMVITPMKKPA
jgi:MFS family permease